MSNLEQSRKLTRVDQAKRLLELWGLAHLQVDRIATRLSPHPLDNQVGGKYRRHRGLPLK